MTEMRLMKIMDFFEFLEIAKCQCGDTRWMMSRQKPDKDETGSYEKLITFCKNCRSTLGGVVKDKKYFYFMSER